MKTALLILTTLCLSACGSDGPSAASGQSVTSNFKLADAIRVYTCAVGKETDAGKKAKLQEGLNIHKYFTNNEEGWTADINKNRNFQYDILNKVAQTYQCF